MKVFVLFFFALAVQGYNQNADVGAPGRTMEVCNPIETVPTINLEAPVQITTFQLQQAMQTGFFYLKVEEELYQQFQQVWRAGQAFFHLSEEEKMEYPMSADFVGWVDRRPTGQNLQQAFMRPEAPFSTFQNSPMKELADGLKQKGWRILREIFQILELTQDPQDVPALNGTLDTMAFPWYPLNDGGEYENSISPHEDFDVLVFLLAQTGLEVKVFDDLPDENPNAWIPVPPKNNHIIVNFGNSLKMMTDGRCKSARHQVPLVDFERLSSLLVISPNMGERIFNLVTDEVVVDKPYAEYLADCFSGHYDEE